MRQWDIHPISIVQTFNVAHIYYTIWKYFYVVHLNMSIITGTIKARKRSTYIYQSIRYKSIDKCNGTTNLRALLALCHKVGTIKTDHLFSTNDIFHSPCLYLTRGSHAKLRKLFWYPQIRKNVLVPPDWKKMSWYPQIEKNALVPPDWKKCPGTPRLEKMSWYPLLTNCSKNV